MEKEEQWEERKEIENQRAEWREEQRKNKPEKHKRGKLGVVKGTGNRKLSIVKNPK